MTQQKTPQIDVHPGITAARNLIVIAFSVEPSSPFISALSFELISRNTQHGSLNTKYQTRSFFYFALFSRPTRQLTPIAEGGLRSTATPVRLAPAGHRWKSTESLLASLSAGRLGSGGLTEISTGPSKAVSPRA